MKTSLIFTPGYSNITSDKEGFLGNSDVNFSNMKFRDQNIGTIPPVSLLTVAGVFESQGVETQIIDQDAEKLRYQQIVEKLNAFSPDLIGFTLTTYNFRDVLPWINAIKRDTGIPIIVGGPHVHLYPYETMSHDAIDYAIIGEAEIPLVDFISAFKNNRKFSGIKSIAYREKNGDVVVERTRQIVDDLNELPFPPLHLIKNENYANILTRRHNFTAMLSARGCPYRCTFCDQKVPPYRRRSAENFVAEIKRNYEMFGIREFDVYDSTFTADRKRVRKICELIDQENLDVGWTIRSRVDSVNEKVLDALKLGGVHTIFYGIESSNPELLKIMKKQISIKRIEETLAYTKSLGIDNLGYFMFGFPGETQQTITDTIDFALSQPLDYAQFSTLVPMPETEIYDYYLERGMEDHWSYATRYPEDNTQIDLIEVGGISREDMQNYTDLANQKFYLRPRIIWGKLKRVRSLENFKRLSRGAGMVMKSWVADQIPRSHSSTSSLDRNKWNRTQ